MKKMTIAEAKKILSARGMSLRKTESGEFRVGIRSNGGEAVAYYATDLDDAVDTGRKMADEREATAPKKTKVVLSWDRMLDGYKGVDLTGTIRQEYEALREEGVWSLDVVTGLSERLGEFKTLREAQVAAELHANR